MDIFHYLKAPILFILKKISKFLILNYLITTADKYYSGITVPFDTAIIIFVFLGLCAGYISSRVYRFYNGRYWVWMAAYTALFFPGFCFFYVLLINWLYRMEGSNIGLKFSEIVSIMILWIGCSAPLVLVGSFLGYKRRSIKRM